MTSNGEWYARYRWNKTLSENSLRALAHLQKEIEEDRDEQWYIDQYNRNRHPSDHIIAGTE